MGRIERNLPNNAYQAAVNANAPGPINTYATLADVLAGSGGNRIITGNAAYSGVGFIYDVTALTYIIQGTLYASAATQVTLTAADPTLGRIDVILVDDLNVVSVLTGTPSATPVKPQVDAASQVEVTFVSVPAGATAPVVVTETVYAEDLGTGGGEWAATTNGTVNLASTNDPHTGTVSIETTGSFGPNKNISFAPGAPYTIVGGQLIFWLNAKSTMVPSYNAMQIGLFDGGVLQGNLVTVGGSGGLTFGFDSSIVGTYQLVTIPLIVFGGVATTIDTIAFIKGGGATTLEFFLDDIDIQEGVPTPPALTAGHTIEDETVSLPQQPILDFQGAGVTVVDDAGNTKTIVTIPGGSGGSLKSGTFDGMELSVGAPTSTFSISAGTGQIADMTVTPVPSITPVSIAGFTNQTIPTLGTSELTYILITSAGAILQQNTPPTPQQLRTHIFLGKLNHANQISITSVANNPTLALGSSDGLEDLMRDAIGIINATPLYPIVTAGLNITTSAGVLFSFAANYDNDKLNPHLIVFPGYDSGVTAMPYLLSDGTIDTPLTNDVRPAIFESPLGTAAAVQASKWTNQRIYATVTGSIVMMYGQTEYVSKALALEGLGSENHVLPALLTSGDNILIAILTLVENTTNLNNNTDAVYQNASKFGEFAQGSVSVTATDLQGAYNNSVDPEIVIPSGAANAFSLQAATDGAEVIQDWKDELGTVKATITGDGTFVGGSTTDSTGVLAGGELSVGAGGPGVATTYDITDGSGHIITATGVKTPVSWTGLTGETPIFGVSVITFVAIDSAGLVVQQSTPFSRVQSRTLIPLGVIVHVNGVNVDTINNEQEIAYNPSSSLYDAMESIGFFNVSGNIFSPNGANLTINKSLGSLFKMGSNYDTAPLDNPHVRTNAATVGGAFQYRFSDGSSGSLANTLIDPDNLDDGAGGLTAVGTNRWSVQRIYIFTSNNIKIQRGVLDYTSSDAAISGLATEPYVTEPSLAANGLFRGWLIIKEGATVLNGVDAIFLSAGKFGESGGSVGSGTTTTLQAAYDNSLDSEIVVPSGAVNAFSLEAETDGAEIVQDWKDETSSVTASMTGDGNLTVLDINGVPITSAGATTSYLNAAGSYTVPAGGGGGTAKFNHTTYSYDYVGASGTWQGTVVAAVGNTEWNDRWRVASFAGTGGADGFYINFRLPLTYVAGTDLKVSLDFSSLTGGGGGTAAIRIGLCQPQVGGAFGTEATTAYAAQNIPVPVTDSISTFIAQFSGTTLNPGDQIAVQVWRDPGNAGDTSNATIYNSSISIDEV